MKRGTRAALIVAGVLIGTPLAIVALSEIFGWNWARPVVEWSIERSTGRPTEIAGDLRVDLGRTTSVVAERVSFGNARWGSDPEMVTGRAIGVRLRLLPLLVGDLRMEEVELEGVRALLEVNEKRVGNWTFSGGDSGASGAAGPAELTLPGELRASDLRIVYLDRATRRAVRFDVAEAIARRRPDGTLAFAADGRYQREPLELRGVLGSIEQYWSDEPFPLRATARFGDTRAAVEGFVREPRRLDGVDLELRLAGESLADLWHLAGLPLAETPPYSVDGRLRKRGSTWGIFDFEGRLGRSDLHGDLSVTFRPERTPLLRAALRSRSMDLDDFEGFWGRRVVEEESNPAAAAQGPLFSDEPFDLDKLTAMDAAVDFRAGSIRGRSMLDDVRLRIALERGRLRWEPLELGFAGGRIVSHATLDARERVATLEGDLVLRSIELAEVLKDAELDYQGHGKIGGRAAIVTHGNSLRQMATQVDGELGAVLQAAELSDTLIELAALDLGEYLVRRLEGEEPVPIRCLVGTFDIDDGRMSSQTLLMDTGVDRLVGEGTIDLAREELDLRLYEHPKKLSFGSLASPIEIVGSFQERKARLDRSGLLKRGGAAIVLGVLLHPAAALLPLVELEEEEEPGACKSALEEYRRVAARPDAEQTAAHR